MCKAIKKRRIITVLLLAILLLIISFVVATTKSSAFQTKLIQIYMDKLAKNLQTEISVEKIDVSFFTGVTLNKLLVKDLHQDTLAFIDKLTIDNTTFSVSDKNSIVDEVTFQDSYFNVKKYQQDSTLNFQFIIDYFTSSDTTKSEWDFKLNKVNFNNCKLSYNNNHFQNVEGIDYEHIELDNFNMRMSDIEFIPKGINFDIENLAFLEKSGFVIEKMSTKFNISPKGIVAQNLKIKTPNSTIVGDVNFLTNNYSDMSDFINKVRINSYFEPSKIDFKDLLFFSKNLIGVNKTVDFEGEIRGKINNIKARKFIFNLDDGTHFRGDVNITGIPDAENMFMHIKVNELITSKRQLEQIPLYPFKDKKFIQLPDNFKHLGTISFKGTYTGFYHDFVTYGSFYTESGKVSTDLTLKMHNGETTYSGILKTTHFNLGKLLENNSLIGSISMNANVDGKGFELNKMVARIKGEISQVEVKGYNYQNITVKGLFAKNIFEGYTSIKDENVDLDFNGSVDFSGKLPKMNFHSNVNKLKLANLHFISDNGLNTDFAMEMRVNLVGNNVDNVLGEIEIVDLIMVDKEEKIDVKSILLKSELNGSIKKVTIESDILSGYLEGEYHFKNLIDASSNNFVVYLPSFNNNNASIVKINNDFKFDITFLESKLLSKLFLNNVNFDRNTSLSGFYHSAEQTLSVIGKFPKIVAGGLTINNTYFESKSTDSKLYLDVTAEKIKQSDSLYIDNFKTSTVVYNDSVLTKINWLNKNTISRTEANLNVVTVFESPKQFTSKLSDSYTYISDTLWTINENNLFKYAKIGNDSTEISIQSLGFNSGNQSILIDGKLSGKPTDQVDMALNNFNLVNIQKIIPENMLKISGTINGVASIKKDVEEIIFTSDLNFDELNLNETEVGNGSVKSIWNPSEKKLSLDGQFYKGHLPSIIFKGDYFPMKKEESLDLAIKLQRADLQLVKKYTEQFISNLKGTASAEIQLNGTLSKPKFNGYITLQKTNFFVNYLNTSFSSPIIKVDIRPDMISFDNVVFFDEKGNKAYSNATVFHDYFKNVSLDLGINATNFFVLNTTLKENELFYGKAFVTGLVNFSIYKNKLNLELDITSEKETVINIPLNSAEEISENDFIEFVSKDLVKKVKEKEVDLSNIEMNFQLHATPDAEVRLIFDDKVGDVIRARGKGDLNININQQGEFKMYGDYVVKDGDYLFTLKNIINKKFNLEEGGKISWNGNPLEAQLNLTAVYRLRARLYELIANSEDSTSKELYKRRIPINLNLNITNTILAPDISFDIDFPTADETTKNKARSVLYMSNQQENIQELNKQVFSLLVLNQFIPPEGGGTAAYSNVGSTTSTEMLSNQLSNWLSKISSDFDIGLNYRPGDEISNQEVELALSTQLFNDRVVLDGNIGMSDNKGATNNQDASNLVGDFSIEYKITEDGKLRVKGFNQSNQFSLQPRSSNYTQGVGLFYRKEFDSFSELFRKTPNKTNRTK